MTVFKNSADGINFGYGCTALQQSHFPWHGDELEEGARGSIVPLDRDAQFLHCTAIGARVAEVGDQVRES